LKTEFFEEKKEMGLVETDTEAETTPDLPTRFSFNSVLEQMNREDGSISTLAGGR